MSFLLLAAGFSPVASEPRAPSVVSVIGTLTVDKVLTQGPTAVFLSYNTGVEIWDFSQPASPIKLSWYRITSGTVDAVLRDKRLYVATAAFGLEIVDLADRVHPFKLGALALPGYSASGIAMKGDTALVLANSMTDSKLFAIDVTNPRAPQFTASLTLPGRPASSLALAGDCLYFGDQDAPVMNIVRVLDGETPTLAARPAMPGLMQVAKAEAEFLYLVTDHNTLRRYDLAVPESPVEVSALPSPTSIYEICLGPGLLFLGEDAQGCNDSNGIEVVDTTDPTRLTVVGAAEHDDYIRSISLAGSIVVASSMTCITYLDVADPATFRELSRRPVYGSEMTYADPYLYLVNKEGMFQVFRADDPKNPVPLGQCVLPFSSVKLVVAYPYVYAIALTGYSENSTAALINVSEPTAPQLEGTAAGFDCQYPKTGQVEGDRLYVAEQRGLRVWDISDRKAFVFLGSYAASVRDLTVENCTVYLLSADRFSVLDATDPANTVVVGSLTVAGSPGRFVTAGRQAYLTGWANGPNGKPGLQVIDLSSPQAPKCLWTGEISSPPHHLAVTGNTLSLQEDGSGADKWPDLQVFDLSDPAFPLLQANLSLPSRRAMVAVGDCLALVGDDLRFVDVRSTRSIPVYTRSLCFPNFEKYAVKGNFIYAYAFSEIQIFDFSTPATPREVSRFPLLNETYDVFVAGNSLAVYQSDYPSNQIVFYDLTDPARPQELSPRLDVAEVGTYYGRNQLLVALKPQTLEVLDPWTYPPRVLGRYPLASPISRLCFPPEGKTLYCHDNTNTLYALDISDPQAIKRLGSITYYPGSTYYEGAAGAEYVYFYDVQNQSRLTAFDFRDPMNPVKINTFNVLLNDRVPGNDDGTLPCAHLWVDGSTVFLAFSKSSFSFGAVDYSIPYAPRFIGYFASPYAGRWGMTVGDYQLVETAYPSQLILCQNDLRGDLNQDQAVNALDLAILFNVLSGSVGWGGRGAPFARIAPDVNQDGFTDILDVFSLQDILLRQ